jgi:ABC-type multidrug transport system ATPase subunit
MQEKVDDLLLRLGLWGCKDTKIGGILFKGLSGGERKRTSIGYELITEP